jgi:hypothetical protein
MPESTGFQYPWQWQTASNVLGRFAEGLPTAMPWQWGYGSDVAAQMAETGMPASQAEWYQQAKGVAETDILDAIKQAAEQAGLKGTRWGRPLGRTAQDIAGRTMGRVGLEWTGRELAAQEAARQRQMQALPQMYQFGAGTAGLTEAAKQRGLQAAGMLPGIGQQYLQAPQDWAQRMMGMGGMMQGLGQQGLERARQEVMRRFPESSPWYQLAGGLTQPGGMIPQQYQPSGFGQLLGGLGSLLPLLLLGGIG